MILAFTHSDNFALTVATMGLDRITVERVKEIASSCNVDIHIRVARNKDEEWYQVLSSKRASQSLQRKLMSDPELDANLLGLAPPMSNQLFYSETKDSYLIAGFPAINHSTLPSPVRSELPCVAKTLRKHGEMSRVKRSLWVVRTFRGEKSVDVLLELVNGTRSSLFIRVQTFRGTVLCRSFVSQWPNPYGKKT